ncbi:white collar 2 type of transcription factor [Blastocladiella emersonii ATCC 22665]|nr:white collar 2 type of transcription factor [Blastocladiella emersonii ATCC 22665]
MTAPSSEALAVHSYYYYYLDDNGMSSSSPISPAYPAASLPPASSTPSAAAAYAGAGVPPPVAAPYSSYANGYLAGTAYPRYPAPANSSYSAHAGYALALHQYAAAPSAAAAALPPPPPPPPPMLGERAIVTTAGSSAAAATVVDPAAVSSGGPLLTNPLALQYVPPPSLVAPPEVVSPRDVFTNMYTNGPLSAPAYGSRFDDAMAAAAAAQERRNHHHTHHHHHHHQHEPRSAHPNTSPRASWNAHQNGSAAAAAASAAARGQRPSASSLPASAVTSPTRAGGRDRQRSRRINSALSAPRPARNGSSASAAAASGNDTAGYDEDSRSASPSSSPTSNGNQSSSHPASITDSGVGGSVDGTGAAAATNTADSKSAAAAAAAAAASGGRPSKNAPPAALQLSKDRPWAQAVVDQISDLILTLAPNGTIMWASPSARQVVGFASNDLCGHHLGEFIHPEDAQLVTRTLTSALARQIHFELTFRTRRKNADYILLQATGRALHIEAHPEDAAANGSAGYTHAAPAAPSHAAPAIPGTINPFALPYGPGGVMAAAGLSLGGSAAVVRPPLIVLMCREYPASAHTSMLDTVVDLWYENEVLRQKLADGYARRGQPVPESSVLRATVPIDGIKLAPPGMAAAAAVANDADVSGEDMAGIVVPAVIAGGRTIAPSALTLGAAVAARSTMVAGGVVPSDILRAVTATAAAATESNGAAADANGSSDTGASANGGAESSSSANPRRKKRKVAPVDHGPQERVCIDCGTTKSPEWRKGPTGAKTLCNACGLRYAKRVKSESQAVAAASGAP